MTDSTASMRLEVARRPGLRAPCRAPGRGWSSVALSRWKTGDSLASTLPGRVEQEAAVIAERPDDAGSGIDREVHAPVRVERLCGIDQGRVRLGLQLVAPRRWPALAWRASIRAIGMYWVASSRCSSVNGRASDADRTTPG